MAQSFSVIFPVAIAQQQGTAFPGEIALSFCWENSHSTVLGFILSFPVGVLSREVDLVIGFGM